MRSMAKQKERALIYIYSHTGYECLPPSFSIF